MAWNQQNYFPVGYQPYQMYQTQMQTAQNPTMSPQSMTPPTIHAEIIQVDDEKSAANYPVGAGSSQMMIARDESAIFVKTATANGQATLDVFSKRPRKPVEPQMDLSEYVRRDEIEGLIAAAMAARSDAEASAKRSTKKEAAEE